MNADAVYPESRRMAKSLEGPAGRSRRLKGDLDNILLKALRKEPERRYGSAEQLAEDVRRHLQGLPVTATPDSVSYRIRKFARRHRVGVAATTLIGVATAGGVITTAREARIAAANERRAEKRFQDVRKLANSLMFEIHDSIRDLPGATPARKLLVQRSQEYLDGLAQEVSGDISVQRELATAYEKLGQVQGAALGSNLGDSTGALVSFSKALTIREAIQASGISQVEDRIALAKSHRLIGVVLWIDLGATHDALDHMKQAVTIVARAAADSPGNATVIEELAEAYRQLGDIQDGRGVRGGAGAPHDALENHRRALALWERLATALRERPDQQLRLVDGQLGVADDLVKTGERDEALGYYQRALRTILPLALDDNNTLNRRLLAICYSRIGDLQIYSNKPGDALRSFQEDFKLIRPLAAADPGDVHLQQKLVGALASMGNALMRMGQVKRGREFMSSALGRLAKLPAHDSQVLSYRALILVWLGEADQKSGNVPGALRNYSLASQIYSSMSSADEQDIEAKVGLSEVHGHLGKAYLQGRERGQARNEYEQARAIAEGLLSSRPDNMEALYALADAYAGLGNAAWASAQNAKNSIERLQQLKATHDWCQKSLEMWERIPNPSRIALNGFELEDAQQITRQNRLAANQLVAVGPAMSLISANKVGVKTR